MNRPEQFLEELIERYPVLERSKQDIYKAYEMLANCYKNGNKFLVAGNGGSSADAQHIVGELMKGFLKKRSLNENFKNSLKSIDKQKGSVLAEKLQEALPAISLGTSNALDTAFLNDVDGQLIVAQEVYGYGNAGDVFMGISTSGNAENINYAAIVAKAKGLKTIALTGKDGGELKNRVDVAIVVDEKETYKIQELHLPIYHTLCLMLETKFFDI